MNNKITVSIPLPAADLVGSDLVDSYVIHDRSTLESASVDYAAIRARLKELDAQERALKQPLEHAKRQIAEFFAAPRKMLEESAERLNASILCYQLEQESKRREIEAALREQAERRRRQLHEEAAGSEAAGRVLEAQLKREMAEATPMPIVAPAEKIKGLSFPETWHAEVTDIMELIRAVLDGRAPVALIEVNMVVANKLAVSLKGTMNFPGLKAVKKTGVRTKL